MTRSIKALQRESNDVTASLITAFAALQLLDYHQPTHFIAYGFGFE